MTCSVDECPKPAFTRGWCAMHYSRWLRNGDPLVRSLVRRPSVEERFWEKVDKSGGPDACWPWLSTIRGDAGYGTFGVRRGLMVQAHRLAFELTFGAEVMGTSVLDHTCHNDSGCPGGPTCAHRRCCNPAHLEPTTRGENALRSGLTLAGANARKTHCDRGHPFTDANTYVEKAGKRHCRTCTRLRKGRSVIPALLLGEATARRAS